MVSPYTTFVNNPQFVTYLRRYYNAYGSLPGQYQGYMPYLMMLMSNMSSSPYNQYQYPQYPYGPSYGYQTPYPPTQYGPYNPQYNYSLQPPSVIGQPMQTGVQILNQAGFNVWLVYQDGVNTGAPTDGYNQRRVLINTQGGIITSEQVG